MHIVAFVAGAWIVVTILWDTFEVLVLPRTPRRRLRLARLFNRSTLALRTRVRRMGTLALERVGLHPDRSPLADEQLAALRASYEPHLAALSARFMMPCPGWRAESSANDNAPSRATNDAASALLTAR